MTGPTLALVQARLGSTRLPGKVLREVHGRPLLDWMLERLALARSLDGVVLLTSGSPKDDPLAEWARARGVALFRGSEVDVLDRYHRAAQEHGAGTVVRLTADCPLIDPAVIDRVVGAMHASPGALDYVANTCPPPATFPDGMDVEVFSAAALERAWREARDPLHREHVTFEFWRGPGDYRILRVDHPEDLSDVRVTVDHADDLEAVERILAAHDGEVPALEALAAFVRGEYADASRGHAVGAGWVPPAEGSGKAPALRLERGDAAFERALRTIPGGAQTFSKMPAQYVDGVAPKVLVRGAGSRVWDADGNEYLDYVLGLGPAVLGHGRREVNEAAFRCAQDLFCSPSLPHPLEAELAEALCELIPCAEAVRFGKNGSDATAGAVRVARGVTGREVIACCGYHGWQDWYIGSTTRSRGVPRAVSELTRPFTYGDLDSLERVLEEHAGNVAGVILEPVGLEEPSAGFLEGVRALCDRHGAVLIFDEIITGFRLHLGGAQAHFGVTPDLATFGKALGNGWPISAVVGRADLMAVLEDAFYSFTFGGELPAIAAALATIEVLRREDGIGRLAESGRALKEGITRAAAESGLTALRPIGLDYWPGYALDGVSGASDQEVLTLMQQELVRRGILTRTALFHSTAHGPADLARTAQAFAEAAGVVAEAARRGAVRDAIDGALIQPVFRKTR